MNRIAASSALALCIALAAASAAAAAGIGALLSSDFARAKVVSVVPGHGADRAGLKAGDEIVAANGPHGPVKLTMLPGAEIRRLFDGPAGSRIALAVRRGRRLHFLSAERTMALAPAAPPAWPAERSAWNALGLHGAYESGDFRVAAVIPGSPAALHGFLPGDRLVAVGRAGRDMAPRLVEFTGTFAPAVYTVLRGERALLLGAPRPAGKARSGQRRRR